MNRRNSFVSSVASFISMRLTWLFLTVSVVMWLALASGTEKLTVVLYAINAIIEKHFATTNANWQGKVNIHWFGRETGEIITVIDKLFKIKSSTTSIRVTKEDFSIKQENFYLGESSIVFFDSLGTFKANALKIKWLTNPRQRTHHLVYVSSLKVSDVIKTFPDGFLIDHVNFLMNETKNSIELVTTFMFSAILDLECRELELKTINRFDMKTLNWENSILYPKKYENFYKCTLRNTNLNGTGIEKYLMHLIFEIKLKAYFDTIDATAPDYSNFDLTHEQLIMQQAILNKTYTNDVKSFIVSDLHINQLITYTVPPGGAYTDLERIFMMFDIETWILIAVTLSIAFLVTLSLNFVSTKIRSFVAGRDTGNPTLNLLSIFLTGCQIKTEKKFCKIFVRIIHHLGADHSSLPSINAFSTSSSRLEETNNFDA